MLLKPNIKNMLGLNFLSFSAGIVRRHSPGGSRFNPKWRTSIYYVSISFACHSTMLDRSKDLSQSNAKMMYK